MFFDKQAIICTNWERIYSMQLMGGYCDQNKDKQWLFMQCHICCLRGRPTHYSLLIIPFLLGPDTGNVITLYCPQLVIS